MIQFQQYINTKLNLIFTRCGMYPTLVVRTVEFVLIVFQQRLIVKALLLIFIVVWFSLIIVDGPVM